MHLALIGYGNIARSTVLWLAKQPVARLTVLVRTTALAKARSDASLMAAADLVHVTDQIQSLLDGAPDLVVECAGHHAVRDYAPSLLRSGTDLVLVSIGAMADLDLAQQLQKAAEQGGAQLILPPGAIGGIDLLSALALAGDLDVTYRGSKPPAAWAGTSAEKSCDLNALNSPFTFFKGSAREAAMSYPKNANVAATLALAGAGFDKTRVELIADPKATGNCHSYSVTSPAGHFTMTIENAASPQNAKTSLATVYSILREINNRRAPVVI